MSEVQIDFEAVTDRLMRAVGLRFESEAAELLEMKPSAFSLRKKSGSFPADRLYKLAAQRPDLRIDVQFVLTGAPSAGSLGAQTDHVSRLEAAGQLPPGSAASLRAANAAHQVATAAQFAALQGVAQHLSAQSMALLLETARKFLAADAGTSASPSAEAGSQRFNDNAIGQVIEGSIHGPNTVTMPPLPPRKRSK